MFEEDSSSEATTSTYHRSPKRRLRFALTENKIHPIPHINDLSDIEVKETWYERSEYEQIKKSLIPLVRKMMKSEDIEETDSQTFRGLEYRTRAGAIRRQHNKTEAITAVLDEQDRQLDSGDGKTDDELLRQTYVQINAHCQQEAHQLALGDVEPAREHCGDLLHTMALVVAAGASGRDFPPRGPPERKSSFSKIFKQMRILRRATLNAERPIAGTAA